ncbi:MAG: ribosomal L7Ae/L30e/S12e/Gadd45 family protein [Nitrososphaerota archaeon]|nr:ribosomal L7Ae/L30e/S12e/Gadd45 family protein [Nitrososphaerota archaeon]MDG6939357.1 ribosomal L7Ae/L30e/S12e/Gadd45 family protein [Nitrososphaerota archaeon]
MESKTLEPFLRTVMKTGKVSFGLKGALKSAKSAKLVVLSTSLGEEEREALVSACKGADVPVVALDDTSSRLGTISRKSFPVKALAVRSVGDADLEKLLRPA